jgi:hypothetical protein
MDVPRIASGFHSIGTSYCGDIPLPGAAQEVLQKPLRGLGCWKLSWVIGEWLWIVPEAEAIHS